ncbi:MAG: 7-carboxy-7-deazaguanine synthase QueE [Sulfurospirillum sp.]
MLKVVEIFYSIQGEGAFAGVASIFIRLHGCNLACSFCDDSLHTGNYKIYDFDAILEEIKRYPSKQIILTGGEPTLYNLNEFINFLHTEGYFICVETNGYRFENIEKADWITYSPKNWDDIKEDYWSEIKFIVSKESDIEKIVNFQTKKPVFIQPLNFFDKPNFENLDFCIDIVKKYPNLKLSIQTHKFLGVR